MCLRKRCQCNLEAFLASGQAFPESIIIGDLRHCNLTPSSCRTGDSSKPRYSRGRLANNVELVERIVRIIRDPFSIGSPSNTPRSAKAGYRPSHAGSSELLAHSPQSRTLTNASLARPARPSALRQTLAWQESREVRHRPVDGVQRPRDVRGNRRRQSGTCNKYLSIWRRCHV